MALSIPPLTSLSRRGFLFGCAAAAYVGSLISDVVFASDLAAADQGDVVVTVFLRGGWDVMNVVPPIDGADRGFYEAARPNLKAPQQGPGAPLPRTTPQCRHPRMAGLSK